MITPGVGKERPVGQIRPVEALCLAHGVVFSTQSVIFHVNPSLNMLFDCKVARRVKKVLLTRKTVFRNPVVCYIKLQVCRQIFTGNKKAGKF